MPGPLITGSAKIRTFTAKRRPVTHTCDCGHTEDLVLPCARHGEMRWQCSKCGAWYKMTFQGEGTTAGESIFKGVF